MPQPPSIPGLRTQLITVQEAAAFLKVSRRTVEKWISQDQIPYVKLPGGGNYRIPLQGMLSSLPGTYDLASEYEAMLRGAERQPLSEGEIAEALGE